MGLRTNIPVTLSAFSTWLADHPVLGDQTYSGQSVRYQVARYCEYLACNPWSGGDPLTEKGARDGAVSAYRHYLHTFDAPGTVIDNVLLSLDRFYVFLGLGPVRFERVAAIGSGRHAAPPPDPSAR